LRLAPQHDAVKWVYDALAPLRPTEHSRAGTVWLGGAVLALEITQDRREERNRAVLRKNEFWSRVFTFVPTATKADGEEIDENAFRKAIDYQIESGVHGVCIFGSTGGNGSFSDEEMKKATAIAAKHIDGRISLVAGTGARTTSACIALSKHA
jgi:hypothetical protein